MIPPRPDAFDYISDGRGNVRIIGSVERNTAGDNTGVFIYEYRPQGSDQWHRLATYNENDGTGFRPVAVDHDLNIAYGWKRLNGRFALYSMSLDAAPRATLVYARPDVDLGNLVRIGRRNRVVGVSYATNRAAPRAVPG